MEWMVVLFLSDHEHNALGCARMPARLTHGTDSSGLAPMKKEQGECTVTNLPRNSHGPVPTSIETIC